MWIDFDGKLVKAIKICKRKNTYTNLHSIVITDAIDREYEKDYGTKEERDQAYFEIYQLISTKSLFYKL